MKKLKCFEYIGGCEALDLVGKGGITTGCGNTPKVASVTALGSSLYCLQEMKAMLRLRSVKVA